MVNDVQNHPARLIDDHEVWGIPLVILFHQRLLHGRAGHVHVNDDELHRPFVSTIELDNLPSVALRVDSTLGIHEDEVGSALNGSIVHVIACNERPLVRLT